MLSDDEATARSAYDQLASAYAEAFPDLGAEAPADRALIDELAQQVRGSGPVLDVGCGTGRVAAHLRGLGLPVVGMDLSAGMLTEARRRHPGLPLISGSLLRLPFGDGSASGVLAWYSVIHTSPADLPLAIAELARVAGAGAPVLLGFQRGQGERVNRTTAFDQQVRRTNYRHRVELVEELLDRYDVQVSTSVVREPVAAHEPTQQAFVLGIRRARG